MRLAATFAFLIAAVLLASMLDTAHAASRIAQVSRRDPHSPTPRLDATLRLLANRAAHLHS